MFIWLNDYRNKTTSNDFCYTNISVFWSTFISEVSYSRYQLIQKPTSDQHVKNKTSESSALNGMSTLLPLLPYSGIFIKGESEKIVEPEVLKILFPLFQQGSCINEASKSVTAFVSTLQAQAKQNFHKKEGSWSRSPPLTEELLAFDICQERESKLTLSLVF